MLAFKNMEIKMFGSISNTSIAPRRHELRKTRAYVKLKNLSRTSQSKISILFTQSTLLCPLFDMGLDYVISAHKVANIMSHFLNGKFHLPFHFKRLK